MNLRPLPAVLLASALLAACGKGENVDDASIVEFPYVHATIPGELGPASHAPWTSGRALAVHADALYVVDQHNDSLVVIGRDDLAIRRVVPVGDRPEQVVVGPDGTAFVTVRGEGRIARIEADSSEVSYCRAEFPDVYGLALSERSGKLYVTVPANDLMVVLDAVSLELLAEVPVFSQPRAVAVSRQAAVVTHQHAAPVMVPLADLETEPELVSIALRVGSPTDRLTMTSRIPRLRGGRAVAATLKPGSNQVYVVHTQTMPGEVGDLSRMASGLRFDAGAPPPVPQYYGPELASETFDIPTRPVEVGITPVLGGGPLARPPVRNSVSDEPLSHRLSDPSDIAHHPTLNLLFVAGQGSDNLVVFDASLTDPMASPIAEIQVGEGPRAIAFSDDGAFAYVLNQQSYTVGVVDLAPFFALEPIEPRAAVGRSTFGGWRDLGDPLAGHPQTEAFTLTQTAATWFGEDPRADTIQRGERVFTHARNARLSRHGHFSCNTCHLEGGEDKLAWVVTDGPRQTPALAERLRGTAPFNWNGTKNRLHDNMQRTVGRMGGHGLTEQELTDLEAFLLDGLPPAPAHRTRGLPEPRIVELGREVFNREDVGCASCHAEETFVDGRDHDVGTLTAVEREVWDVLSQRGDTDIVDPAKFNTPSLLGLRYTAPYLHDGSAETLRDVLELTAGRMGHIEQLDEEELEALVAYLKTL